MCYGMAVLEVVKQRVNAKFSLDLIPGREGGWGGISFVIWNLNVPFQRSFLSKAFPDCCLCYPGLRPM